MSAYDFRDGKLRVEEILNNQVEIIEQQIIPNDTKFSFENGYYGWVTAIFVDIRDSSALFKNKDKEATSRIIRSFASETIEILRSDSSWREIGVRGDCVYAIYTTPNKNDEYELANKAFYINTYIIELNQLLSNKKYPQIKVGIGVSTAKELVVKAGRKGSGINNFVWIGEAVTIASKLSSLGNKNGLAPIIFSQASYLNFIDILEKQTPNIRSSFKMDFHEAYGTYYSANIVSSEFKNWIDEGMPV